MQNNPIAKFSFIFVSIAIFFGAFTLPVTTLHAATPVTMGIGGTNSVSGACDTPLVSGFAPHIYEGHLDSFDYTIDSSVAGYSHLPLFIKINGEDVDLQYASVWKNLGANRTLIHVDVPENIELGIENTISVQNLQITNGPPPICLSGADFHVKLPNVTYSEPQITTTPINNPASIPTDTTKIDILPDIPVATESPDTSVTEQEGDIASSTAASVGQCTEVGKWWLYALAVLDIIISIGLLLFMSLIATTNLRLALAVLLPPALFIGSWYIFNSCHSEVWFPILAVVLAIIVLTGSGTPDAFDKARARIMQIFGKRTKNSQMKLSEASSILEVR